MTAIIATVGRMTPNPKRALDADDARRIKSALSRHERSYADLRAAVLDAAENGASVRVLAEFTGMSTNTISRWKNAARQEMHHD